MHHLKFIRLWDLLDHPGPWTPEFYKTHASCIRREMVVRFRDLEFEKDMASKSTEDVRMTHAGYLKNVAKDLAHSPILTELDDEARELKVQSIAKSMMGRWRAYASALEPWESGNGYVRLSIHDSKGGSKLSMALVPQARGAIGFTPWHSAVVVELDGTYRPAHVSEVRDTHDLVSVNGQPYYYRAKTDLFDWKADGLEVEFNFLYPTGLRITAKGEFSVRDLPSRKVRKLANNFSPLLLSAFKESTDRSLLEAKGNELGKALTKHDGHTPYRILLCSSTADKPAASAMYTNSRLLFRHLPAPWTMENVQTIVASHKETGAPCLIRGDSWDGVDPSLAKMAADLMLDERVTLRYELQQGEVLITDSSLVVYSKLPDNPDSDRDLQELGFE